MKLTDIDLTSKEEIAAAHALLAAIMGLVASDDIPGAPSVTQTLSTLPVVTPPTVRIAPPPGDRDPAAVFGAQSGGPLPHAPSSAGAAALSTAPVALPGSLPGMVANPPPAALIAPVVHAQNQAAVAALSSPAVGVELDSKGLPWDERIHAGSKSKTKPGAWTAKRGVDEATVQQVEAELRALVAGGQQPQSATPLTLPGMPVGIATTQAGSIQLPISAPAAALPGVAAADPVTFEQLMPRVTSACLAGQVPPTAMQEACVALGLTNVVALQTNPAYVPHVWAHLRAAYPALQ